MVPYVIGQFSYLRCVEAMFLLHYSHDILKHQAILHVEAGDGASPLVKVLSGSPTYALFTNHHDGF
jgi:hypothetical protein